MLTALAAWGFWHWNPTNLTRGAPGGSVWGILNGMAATFIAFEGFEMIAYDHRELRAPKRIMSKGLAAAVIAVGLAYALVTVGAASLVGADVLIKQKENALAGAKSGWQRRVDLCHRCRLLLCRISCECNFVFRLAPRAFLSRAPPDAWDFRSL